MSDFDTITNILDRVYPNKEDRPYYSCVLNGKLILEFPQSDEYYNTCLVFDEDGKFEQVDQFRLTRPARDLYVQQCIQYSREIMLDFYQNQSIINSVRGREKVLRGSKKL